MRRLKFRPYGDWMAEKEPEPRANIRDFSFPFIPFSSSNPPQSLTVLVKYDGGEVLPRYFVYREGDDGTGQKVVTRCAMDPKGLGQVEDDREPLEWCQLPQRIRAEFFNNRMN